MSIRHALFALLTLFAVAPVRAEDFGEIRCVQFSPNGRLAAFCSNASIKLWDTAINRKVGELKGPTEEVLAFTFAPDGKTLFSCGRDNRVRQWNLANGQELRQFDGHTDIVTAVAVAPDGKTLASAGHDNLVRLWDISTGKELRQFKRHTCPLAFVAFSPDGKTAVSGGGETAARLWNVETCQEMRTFAGNEGHVRSAVFTADGKQLITGGVDHSVRIYDLETGRELRQCHGHTSDLFRVMLSPDGHTLATAGHDSTLRLWDVGTGQLVKTIDCHKPGVLAVGFSPNGRSLISGGLDCNVKLWETATGQLRADYTANEEPADKPPEQLSSEQLETLWKMLEGNDARKAFTAIGTLSARPQDSVPFLQKQLKAAQGKVDTKIILKWIANLDDEDFTTRETAQAELIKLGRVVKGAVQETLAKTKSVEKRRRLTAIVKALEKNDLPAQGMRETRALEVLENANTPAARQLLETLATGAPEAELTMDAKATLGRLSKQTR